MPFGLVCQMFLGQTVLDLFTPNNLNSVNWK